MDVEFESLKTADQSPSSMSLTSKKKSRGASKRRPADDTTENDTESEDLVATSTSSMTLGKVLAEGAEAEEDSDAAERRRRRKERKEKGKEKESSSGGGREGKERKRASKADLESPTTEQPRPKSVAAVPAAAAASASAAEKEEAAEIGPDLGPEEDEEEDEEDEGREVIVHLDNIHKTYLLGVEGVPALRGVTLSVYRGEWLAIYGTSGGGKTTMLNIIGTIDKPTKGEMTVGDVVVNPDTKDHELASIRLNTLGFVFQTFNLLSAMSARENVELPMVLKGEKSAKERRAIAEESLAKMGLSGRMDHFPNMLSGGEQQRVTIARAIANTPDLLLLDEPTGDLDSKNTDVVIKMLNRLNVEEGMTLVMVTHDMYLKNFADRVVWMRDGKIQKIEKISKKKKEEAFRELESNSKVQLSDVSTTAAGHGGTPTVTSLKDTEGWTHTEVRDPSNYRMFLSKKAADDAQAKKKKKKKAAAA